MSDIPKHPVHRRLWIIARLHGQGITLSELAKVHNTTASAFSHAARGMPNKRLEAVLAKACGVRPQELFPEHYSEAGRRLIRSHREGSPSRSGAGVKSAEAA
ncbi:helix-turn-helix domain-containing protein [Ferrovibrio sp.]|uniref:helix-turn-helix domain-containing protein n=1 Tax=Ferrovibrio sp. TaxID=1917215 RepID=UPI0025C5C6D5|nr:helix-turn-helix domain-containing protein [Ferrovibrio sp.]MBX3455794.1 helix-turn-helix domain-containing protein [Ferrovibrio sp.]